MSFNWGEFSLLVVEDDEAMRDVLCYIFDRRGAQVFSAENGKLALNILEVQKIDLIVSDIQMPVMDGVALLKQVRTQNSKLPVVLLLTGQSQMTEESAVSLGASGLIQKPFNLKAFIDRVQQALLNRP